MITYLWLIMLMMSLKRKPQSSLRTKLIKETDFSKVLKNDQTLSKKKRIADLNCEIRSHFFGKTKFKVCKGILPGNSKPLWHAVKIAKNCGESTIPRNMTLNNEPVKYDQLSEGFAEFFEKKVGDIVRETVVIPRVYGQ